VQLDVPATHAGRTASAQDEAEPACLGFKAPSSLRPPAPHRSVTHPLCSDEPSPAHISNIIVDFKHAYYDTTRNAEHNLFTSILHMDFNFFLHAHVVDQYPSSYLCSGNWL
jgi:hypothetical protein